LSIGREEQHERSAQHRERAGDPARELLRSALRRDHRRRRQKTIARVHELDPALLDALWAQQEARALTAKGLVMNLEGPAGGATHTMPRLPDLRGAPSGCGGFSFEVRARLDDLSGGRILFDTRRADGAGVVLATTDNGSVKITLGDGRDESGWECDPGILVAGRWHHIVVIVDGGPKIVTFVVDGGLCDGGDHRQFGWGRFHPEMGDVTGAGRLQIAPGPEDARGVRIGLLRLYNRPLLTSEAVANHRQLRDPR
jgi:hypothetical protein